MNLQRKFNNEDLRTLMILALENSQSQSFEQLTVKNKLLAKLKNEVTGEGEIIFTSDEIVLIKNACLKTLRDGATLAIMEEICPNDLI